MDKKKEIHLSKFISLLLRHKPETIGLQLDENGWANVDELIEKSNRKGVKFNFDDLKFIVQNCNKTRYDFNEDFSKIRANQGHSIQVNLELKVVEPPEILYHGTAKKNLESILKMGIDKINRNHVHLSTDIETASKVGARHGQVIILEIDAEKMFGEGIEFYLSKNKVWLTNYIDAKYISVYKNIL